MFDYTTFPVLTTERLVLRESRVDDAADVLVFRSDRVAQRFNSEPLGALTDAVALINELRDGYASQNAVQWVLARRETGRVVGIFGLDDWESSSSFQGRLRPGS